jgi:hypothetical protein
VNAPTDRDDEFESAVRTRRRLVPRFDDTDDAEPSPELDRIVLARARDAMRPTVPTRPDMRERHYRGPRWAVPLALVATVLLSFTLVFQLDPARNEAVLAPREAAPVMATPEAAGELAGVAAGAAADGAADASAAAPPAIAAAASPRSAVSEVTASPAPMAKRAPAAATTPPPSASEADVPASAAQPSRAAEPQAGSRAGAPPRPDGSPTLDTSDPDAWLERIEGLRRNGAAEAARQELAAFVQRFPQHPLPAALEALRSDSLR